VRERKGKERKEGRIILEGKEERRKEGGRDYVKEGQKREENKEGNKGEMAHRMEREEEEENKSILKAWTETSMDGLTHGWGNLMKHREKTVWINRS
jgi:hypothetical protein